MDWSWIHQIGDFLLLVFNNLSVLIMGSSILLASTVGLWVIRKVVDIIKRFY